MAVSDFQIDIDWMTQDPKYFWLVADNSLNLKWQEDQALAANGTNANNNTTRAQNLDQTMTGDNLYAITRAGALEMRRIRELMARSVELEQESITLMTRLCGKLRAL